MRRGTPRRLGLVLATIVGVGVLALGCSSGSFTIAPGGDAGHDGGAPSSIDAAAGIDASDAASDAPSDGASPCGVGEIVCSGRCVNPSTDPSACGGCGTSCGAGACVSGVCTGCSGATCGGACVDTSSDPLSCGDCGKHCAAADYCVGGACACRPGTTACGGSGCFDLARDPAHCGDCGNSCAGDETCRSGACVPLGVSCPSGQDTCAIGGRLTCVATRTDAANCGGCGNACAANQLCVNGGCEDYKPAMGCTTCPCGTCAKLDPRSTCCPALPGQKSPICLLGYTGPCP